MSPLNFGTEFMDSLGLAGAMALGTQNRQSREETDLGMMIKRAEEQRKAQMHPLEMEAKQANTGLVKAQTQEKMSEEERKKWKDYMDWVVTNADFLGEGQQPGAFGEPPQASPMITVSRLRETAIAKGIDPNDPKLRQVLEYSMRPGGVQQMAQMYTMKNPEARKKSYETDEQIRAGAPGLRSAEGIATARDANQLEGIRLQGQNQKEVEQMRIDAGKYDKQQKDAEFYAQKAVMSGNFQAAATAYDWMAQVEMQKPDANYTKAEFYRKKADEYRKAAQGLIPGTAPPPGKPAVTPLTKGAVPTNPATPMPGTTPFPSVQGMPGVDNVPPAQNQAPRRRYNPATGKFE